MNKLFCLSVIAFSFAACNSNSANHREPVTQPTATPTLNLPSTTGDTSIKGNTTTTLQAPPVSASPQTKTRTTKTGAGLNPAHGLPGHRCDIAEGAPLNSAPMPATTNVPVNNMNTTVAPPVMQPQPSNSKVKLNPAHGLPGHDCSIAVGQPLKN